ncbi:uncharacterized protein [Nicotiana sylvestris]|uniref:uncharacterized protein n=1 Tax=Nicotiana sylvestris TaxID=4096 RepID=UPI00388C9737
MLDGGSSVDICPLSTLQRMEVGTGRIHPNNVLDMDTSYNFLLRRPWIHVAGAVPSTLHQMVKFEYEDREIVYKEGSPCPQPFLSNASIMVAKEMIRQGFKPRKGLGKSLQGITEPITLPSTKKLFGIGFQPNPKDEDWEKKRKNEGWKLPRPLPHLYEIFVRPKYIEEEDDEAFTAEEIEEICGAMREMLYEAHMVQLGEGTSTAEVLMDEKDAEKTTFTTPWGTYCYQVMPFSLKNAGATYMRAMTAIFHDMMHQEIEVYVDDVIIKSRTQDDHVRDLRKFFERLRKYDLKLNPAKCAFGVPSGKLLGFIVSRRGIELDPTKIKSIRDLPPPRMKKDVMSLLGSKARMEICAGLLFNWSMTEYSLACIFLQRSSRPVSMMGGRLEACLHDSSQGTTFVWNGVMVDIATGIGVAILTPNGACALGGKTATSNGVGEFVGDTNSTSIGAGVFADDVASNSSGTDIFTSLSPNG